MPNFLSPLFATENDTQQDDTSAHQSDSQIDLEASPQVDMSTHLEGSYDRADGSTTQWESDGSIAVHADIDAHIGQDSGVTLNDGAF